MSRPRAGSVRRIAMATDTEIDVEIDLATNAVVSVEQGEG